MLFLPATAEADADAGADDKGSSSAGGGVVVYQSGSGDRQVHVDEARGICAEIVAKGGQNVLLADGTVAWACGGGGGGPEPRWRFASRSTIFLAPRDIASRC